MPFNLRRFASGYYVANTLLLSSYILIRQYFYGRPLSPYATVQYHAELEKWVRLVSLKYADLSSLTVRSDKLPDSCWQPLP